MELKNKVTSLNNFLTDIYDEEMRLSLLLKKLNVSSERINFIAQHCLSQVVDNYIDSVKMTLSTYENGLLLYHVIGCRYGFEEYDLDTLQVLERELVINQEKTDQIEQEGLEICRLEENKELWESRLYDMVSELTPHIALNDNLQAVNVKRSVDEKFVYLQELQAQSDLINSQKQELIKQIIPVEIRNRLDQLEIEFNEKTKQINQQISLLEHEIKSEVILHGATVRSEKYTVVFQGGNRIWDSQKLKLYAKSHPEILELRKQSKPYAIIKRK